MVRLIQNFEFKILRTTCKYIYFHLLKIELNDLEINILFFNVKGGDVKPQKNDIQKKKKNVVVS